MQTGQFSSAADAVRLIARKEGFKGLYAVCNPPFSIPILDVSAVVIFYLFIFIGNVNIINEE